MFKNMKIKKKLILSCIIIAIVASISGIFSSAMMAQINAKYDDTLTNLGFAQGDVGKALAAFCRTDGNIHDAISYFRDSDIKAAVDNIPKWEAKFEEYMGAIEVTLQSDEANTAYETIMSAWSKYKDLAGKIVAQGTRSDEQAVIQAAQERLVDELDPIYGTIYNGLADLMAIKVDMGNDAQEDALRTATIGMVTAVVLVIAAIVLSLTFGTILANSISKPMHACSERLALLSEGDLTTPVPDVQSKDEVGELAASTVSIVTCLQAVIRDIAYLLGEMSTGNFDIKSTDVSVYRGELKAVLESIRKINYNLSDALGQIGHSAEQVAAGASQVSDGAQALAQGATQQASSVEELSATIEEISDSAQKNAESSKIAKRHSEEAGAQLTESSRNMEKMMDAMDKIKASSDSIGKIIATIENIAFQTNILALNAAVEAARAGSAGKGFAVVADEVRNLASKSDEAAKATKELIENSIQSAAEGDEIAKSVVAALDKTVDATKALLQDIQAISESATREAEAISQVTEGVDQISAVVQNNSATSEESAASSEELSSQAVLMKDLLARFKLRSEAGTHYRSEPQSSTCSAVVQDKDPSVDDASAPEVYSFSKY